VKWLAYKDSLYNIKKYSKIEFSYDFLIPTKKFTPIITFSIREFRETVRGDSFGIAYKNEKEAEEANKNAKLEFYLWIQALDEWFITFEELYGVPPKKRVYKKSMEMRVLP
jgi:hypothetical protein